MADVKYEGASIFWRDSYPPGSPPHSEIPYGFKTWAFKEALARGHDVVMWVDASGWAVQHPQRLFEYIRDTGWLLEDSGFGVGSVCSDRVMGIIGKTRDELMKIPTFCAGFTGLNLKNEKAQKFLDRWHYYSSCTDTFVGPWTNKNGEASSDSCVLGHRHDLTMGSIAAFEVGLTITPPRFIQFHAYKPDPTPDTFFFTRGF